MLPSLASHTYVFCPLRLLTAGVGVTVALALYVLELHADLKVLTLLFELLSCYTRVSFNFSLNKLFYESFQLSEIPDFISTITIGCVLP